MKGYNYSLFIFGFKIENKYNGDFSNSPQKNGEILIHMGEIEINPLVKKLYEALKKRKVTVPRFAVEAGIPKDRVYKWKQEGTSPKAEDVTKINKWIAGRIVEKPPGLYKNDEGKLSSFNEEDAFLNLYIDSLLEQKRILEVQNDFLRRNFEVSLNSIAESQHAANSQLKALGWYQALVANDGDEKKAEEALVKVNNKAAWYGGVISEESRIGDRGSGRK